MTHTLNSECKTASQVCVCVCVSMHVWASICSRQSVQNVPGLTGSWQHGHSFLKPMKTNTHPRLNWRAFTELWEDRTSPLQRALLRNHRQASPCLLKKLTCNSSGCSFPGCRCNSQEITISIDLLTQIIFTVIGSQSACLLYKEM